MKFPTHAVLSASTGKLMGDIGGLYSVASFLLGRPAFTHELAFYGEAISKALREAEPTLPGPNEAEHVNKQTHAEALLEWQKHLGAEIDLPDGMKGILADDRNAISTLVDMLGKRSNV